jgi:hypothetical protein
MRRLVARAALALGAIVAVGPSGAWAGEPPVRASRTVVLVAAHDDPIGTRVNAELRAVGFDVDLVEVARPAAARGDPGVDLSGRSASTVAAIAIGARGGEVRVWTIGSGSDGLVLRATIENDADPAIVALRTVEALRTSVNDLQPQARGPLAPGPATSPPPPATDDRRGPGVGGPRALRWGASLAPAFSVSAGEAEASWHALAVVHVLWGPRWGVEALGVIPLSDTRWTETEGSALVTYALVAAGARWEAFAARRQTGDVGVGVGAAFLHAEGSPAPGFSGTTLNTTAAAPYARIGYAVAVAPWLRMRADLAAFVAVPRPVLTFAGRDAGSWGQPLLAGSIGVEIVSR